MEPKKARQVYRSARELLRRALQPTTEGGEAEAGQPEQPPALRALRRLIREAGPQARLRAGALHMIGLDPVQRRLGEHWPAAQEHVHQLVAALLREHLDERDVFYRLDPVSYFLLFAGLDREQAGDKAAALAEAIRSTLAASLPDADRLAVRAAVMELPVAALRDAGSMEEMAALLKDTVAETPDSPPTAELVPVPASPPPRAEPEPEPEPVPVPVPAGTLWDASLPERCPIRFRPVWNQRNRLFSAALVTVLNPDTGQPIQMEPGPHPASLWGIIEAFDRAALNAAVRGLKAMAVTGRRAVVVVPVHYETLAGSRSREALLEPARMLPAEVRRMLAFELDDVPVGTPRARLQEIVGMLRPCARSIMARIPLDARRMTGYAEAGCFAVSTNLPGGGEAGALLPELSGFARRGSLLNLDVMLRNADSPAALAVALKAGFRYVSGSAAAELMETPGPLDGTLPAPPPA